MQQLQNYTWPGYVREMRNVIERAAIISTGRKLHVEPLGATADTALTMDQVRTEAEIQLSIRANLVSALKATDGKVSGPQGAAALLEMRPTTVYSRIKAFAIKDHEWE